MLVTVCVKKTCPHYRVGRFVPVIPVPEDYEWNKPSSSYLFRKSFDPVFWIQIGNLKVVGYCTMAKLLLYFEFTGHSAVDFLLLSLHKNYSEAFFMQEVMRRDGTEVNPPTEDDVLVIEMG